MTQFYVRNEGDAELAIAAIIKLARTKPTKKLPTSVLIVVPSQAMKKVMKNMITADVMEDSKIHNQNFLMALDIICPSDIQTDDEDLGAMM